MKKLISFIVILGIILSYSISVSAAQTTNVFTDVDFSTSAGKDIQKLYNAGVVNGNGDGTFTPNNPVTRAELCKMVNKIRKYTAISDANFTDVTTDKWYYTQVLIGKQAGYINGFPDGTFRGDDYITREQVCAVVCRAFGVYDLGINAGITDSVSDWAASYVNALVANKLIDLESGNTFRATENMKRGELATVLAKFVVETPVVTPPSTGGSTGGSKPGGSTGGSTGGSRPGGSSGGSTGGSTPSNPTPDNPTPDNPTPDNPTPDNPTPDNPTPDNPTPDNPTPDNPTPDNPTPDNPTPDNPTPDNPTPDNPTPDNPTPDEPTPDEPTPDEPEGMTKEEIIAANEEVLIYFRDVYNDLDAAIEDIESDTTYEIMSIVMSCLERAITVGESGEVVITKSFINTEYKADIDKAKSIYYELGETAQGKVLDDIDKTVKKQSTKEYLMDMFL